MKRVAVPGLVSTALGGAQWAPDGRAVYGARSLNYVFNIWLFPLDDSPPKQVTNFTSESMWNYALSPDGRRLAIARGQRLNDIVLIKDFR